MNYKNILKNFLIPNNEIKKILSLIKKYILLKLKNKYNNNYKIKYKKGKILIFKRLLIINKEAKKKKFTIKYSKIKNKKKYKIGDIINKKVSININHLKSISKYIYKIFKNYNLNRQYKLYKNKIGKLIKLKVKNINKNILILKDKYKYEYIYKLNYNNYNNFFKIYKYYYFLIKKVIFNKKKIKIILSIREKLFIKNLLKLYIPEISEGLIKIKDIVRVPGPGGKTKVIVYTLNENINPIGACLGIKGLRLKNIHKELDNEKIEIINYSKNIYKYIKNVFNNIKINSIKIKNNKIYLYIKKQYLGLLIGKNGINIKLSKLLFKQYKLVVKCQ